MYASPATRCVSKGQCLPPTEFQAERPDPELAPGDPGSPLFANQGWIADLST
jgi:hypothetical protein